MCYVFTNSTQLERLQNEMRGISTNAFIEYILTDQKGKNLVDIELSFYTGMIYSLYRPYKVIIQSNDNGFDTVTRACNEIGFDNIENYHPVKEDLVSDNKCVWIYWHILNTKTENVMSLGNFKKRVKKSQLSITADEVNYVVKRLEEIGYIKITDNQGYKVINFQKKKKK